MRRMRRALGPVLALGACAAGAGISGAGIVENVDFRNFTYQPSCTVTAVRVVAGKYIAKSEADRFAFRVVDVTYGDLTGDGREEAVVTTYCSTGGLGGFTEAEVYSAGETGVTLLARVPGGDRAFGSIQGIRIVAGELVISRLAPETPQGPACCPKFVDTSRYRIEAGRLVPVGASERSPFVEPTATPAATGAVVTGTITCPQCAALPPAAQITVRLVDVTDPSRVSIVVERVFSPTSQAPVQFELPLERVTIDPGRAYAIEASIAVDGKVRFAAMDPPRVLTQGRPATVEVVVTPI